MEKKLEKSLFEIPATEFQEHLAIPDNSKILFSGKFGKGKTTFLKAFFDNPKFLDVREKYFPIYLTPVNYSIASNEDVIKYIKYDIVLEFLRKELDFDSFDLEFKQSLSFYIYKHPEQVIGKLISFIPFLGKELDELLTKGEKLFNQVNKYKDELKKKSEGDVLITYLENIESTQGSLYEDDFITKIIEKRVVDIREKDGAKVVLIIDDLDRLDPEHIFRILNVFASHFDSSYTSEKQNKFGVDKIILVCDLMNIRNIYMHRYGPNVDFIGYIDKFYSKEPFYFFNQYQLQAIADKVLNNIRVQYFDKSLNLLGYTRGINNFNLNQLVHTLLFHNIISLRSLLNFSENHVISGEKLQIFFGKTVRYRETSIIAEAEILTKLLGGYRSAIETINRIILNGLVSSFNFYDLSCGLILWFYDHLEFTTGIGSERTFILNDWEITFKTKGFVAIEMKVKDKSGNTRNFPSDERDYFLLLSDFLSKLYSEGVIQ